MDLYNLCKNILHVDILEEVKNSISYANNKYRNLTKERTCFLYSSFIHEYLLNHHISSRIVSTKDFDMDYEHQFVIAKDDNLYYLIDVNYRYVVNIDKSEFSSLLTNGYQKMSSEEIYKYLETIGKIDSNKNIDDMYFGHNKKGF